MSGLVASLITVPYCKLFNREQKHLFRELFVCSLSHRTLQHFIVFSAEQMGHLLLQRHCRCSVLSSCRIARVSSFHVRCLTDGKFTSAGPPPST